MQSQNGSQMMRRAEWVFVALVAMALGACSRIGGGGTSGQLTDDASVDVLAAEDTALPTPDSVWDATVGDTAVEDVGIDAGPARPPRVCRAGPAPAGPAFTDVTEGSGLKVLGVNGVRLSAADIDGDGLVDLCVRDYKQGVRDDFAGGERHTWLLHNDGALTFSDVTQGSGFTTTRDEADGRTTHIVVWADIDNDGDTDAISALNVSADQKNDNGDRTEVLLNDGSGGFELANGGDIRHETEPMATGGATFTDLNRDGHIDLWMGYGAQGQDVQMDRVYLGDGTGSFSDWTAEAGITTVAWMYLADLNAAKTHRNSWGTAVRDINGDGWPDLLSSSYGRAFNGLWMSDGAGGFLNASVPTLVGADQRMDWTTNYNAQCYCKLVPTAPGCVGVPAPPAFFPCSDPGKLRWNHDYDREPFRLGGNTFSTICGDIDNDGDMDLMHTEIVHWDVGDTSDPTELLFNDGSGTFERPGSEVTGLVREWGLTAWNAGDMTGALFDYDNDGRLDVYIGSSDYPGTRGFLFHQKQDGTFEEIAASDGIDHPRSHGVAVVDFDRDGDLDVAVGHGISRCENDASCYPTMEVHLFRNDVGQAWNSLQVRLVGAQGSNRSAIGARVRVTAGGMTQTREIDGGHGHYGIQHGLVAHFGLGAACDVEKIEVRWPDAAGTTETFEDVLGNYAVTITQGAGLAYDIAGE